MQNYNAKTIKQTAIYQWFCLTKPGMDKYIDFCADGNNAAVRLVRKGRADSARQVLWFLDKLSGLDFWSIHIGRGGLEP